MPVFGKSLFDSLLDRLNDEAAESDGDPSISAPRTYGHVPFVFDSGIDDHQTTNANFADFFDQSDPAPDDELSSVGETIPAWLDRLDEADVEADLDLKSCETMAALRERRRAFARTNHPDRVKPQYRDQANLRMTIANRLVDIEIRRRLGK